MSRFRDSSTGVVVSVDDSKDDRYSGANWEPADKPAPKAPAAKKAAAPSKTEK